MNWLFWALLSAGFAGLTAILAKVGVKDVDSNLATAIRTTVILAFAWLVAAMTNRQSLQTLTSRTWLFLTLSGLATGASWLCYFRALQLGEASKVRAHGQAQRGCCYRISGRFPRRVVNVAPLARCNFHRHWRRHARQSLTMAIGHT